MSRFTVLRSALLGSVAAGALFGAMSTADAGGFAVREQSAQFQGTSYAGSGAGGGLSSMFWNSAAAAQAGPGLTMDSNYALILGNVEMTRTAGGVPGANPESGNIAIGALVPGSYAAYRLSSGVVLAASLNAPFGLTTKPDNVNWAGRTHAITSSIKTYNLNAVAALNLGNGISIGIGPQVQLIKGRLTSAGAIIEADDVGFGFTAGVLWEPTKTTSIGVGFRSAISHTLEGTAATAAGVPGVQADLKTPETVNLSLRQQLTSQLTALATVEWNNWSNVQELNVQCKTATPGLCAAGGSLANSPLKLGWHDGWLFAGGLEYAYSPALTLRGGLAYEKSPVENPSERTPRVPDADRIWASIGAGYKLTASTTVELAYSHVFVKDATLVRAADASTGGIALSADVDARVDIISVGVKTKW